MNQEGQAVVGYKVTKDNLNGKPIPLTIGRAPAQLSLQILYTLEENSDGELLAIDRSNFVVCDASTMKPWLRYEFGDDPDNDFPASHLHIHGASEIGDRFNALVGHNRGITEDFHFPVGGPNCHPSLEDVIEFLIREGLVKAREGWEKSLADSRALQKQLIAA